MVAVSPKVAIFNVRTMTQVVEDSMWEVNLYRWLVGLFALENTEAALSAIDEFVATTLAQLLLKNSVSRAGSSSADSVSSSENVSVVRIVVTPFPCAETLTRFKGRVRHQAVTEA